MQGNADELISGCKVHVENTHLVSGNLYFCALHIIISAHDQPCQLARRLMMKYKSEVEINKLKRTHGSFSRELTTKANTKIGLQIELTPADNQQRTLDSK